MGIKLQAIRVVLNILIVRKMLSTAFDYLIHVSTKLTLDVGEI